MKNRFYLAVLFCVSIFFISGCAVAPKKFAEYKEGQWGGKALVYDKKENKRGIVNVKIKAVADQKLRMDVVAPMGDHVASIVINGEDMECLFVKERQFVKSKANGDSLRYILKVPLEPEAFYDILFDRPIVQKKWTCTNESGFLKSCRDLKGGVVVSWVLREGENRTIKIDHAMGSLQINLNEFSSAIDAKDTSFALVPPKSFKFIQRQ